MYDRKKLDLNKILNPLFCRDPVQADFTVTFQPKSAQASLNTARPSQGLYPKNEKKISNKIYFQEMTRKDNISRHLPPLPHSIPKPNSFNSGRQNLKSDSIPTRSKKPEIIEAMNSSSIQLSSLNCVCSERYPENFPLEIGQIKTPTFNLDYDKNKHLKEYSQGFIKENTERYSKGHDEKMKVFSVKNDSSGSLKLSGQSSTSKMSGIGSSVSTEFAVLSPSFIPDQSDNQKFMLRPQYGRLSSRYHPKVKVRKTGFPVDVFTIKYNE